MTAALPPPRTATSRVRVRRHTAGDAIGGRATLAVEEPLEIRVDGTVVATTMRTPGNDFDLALGFAITDGGIDPGEVAAMAYCGPEAGEVAPSSSAADLAGPYAGDFNVVNVTTRSGGGPAVHRHRATTVSTACGICGADVVADLRRRAGSVAGDDVHLTAEVLAGIPPSVRAAQEGFEATGATHAAAAATAAGDLVVVREDVGRHNAVDKVVGALSAEGRLPADGLVLFTSGRVAFEIVAKAVIAGFAVVVAVSAPTSLAVQTAEDAGLTLAGFVRDDAFTLYSRADRVVDPARP